MRRFFVMAMLALTVTGLHAQNWQIPEEIEPIEAPFEMPQLKRPEFPARTLYINKAGARQGKLCTAAIQKAIDRMAAKGGGTVAVPAGKWLTGRIELKSNVCLRIDEGAELHFSGNLKDYQPAVLTRDEGIDLYSLGAMIYANGAENIAIVGKGKLVAPSYDCEISRMVTKGVDENIGKMPLEQRVFDGRENGGEIFLPLFFGPIHCKNILVEGLTFEKSIFWNIAPTYCENTIIRGITVNSHGRGRTDGIDIDSSINSLIEYTTLDCGDDCFTLKAGRGKDGVDKKRPTENVVIRHCHVKRGVGGIAIGSETAAMIRNVYATDLVIDEASRPLYFKTRRPRGGGAENIWLENTKINKCNRAAVFFDMLGSPTYVGKLAERHPTPAVNELTPMFRNITLKNIEIGECPMLIKATGLPEMPIEGLTLENVKSPNMLMKLQDVGTITIK